MTTDTTNRPLETSRLGRTLPERFAKRVVGPGLAMLTSQLRAFLGFADPAGVGPSDVFWMIVAGGFTVWFIVQWKAWQSIRLINDRNVTRLQTTWPLLGAFLLWPAAFVAGYGWNYVQGPSPYAALSQAAIDGCQLDGIRGLRKVGVLVTADETLVVHNIRSEHSGSAIVRNRTTAAADYRTYQSQVLDGRDLRASRVLCFEDEQNATLRDIATGAKSGSAADLAALVDLAYAP